MTIPSAELSKVRQYITQALVAATGDLGPARADNLMALLGEPSPVPGVVGAMEILYDYVQTDDAPVPAVIPYLAAFAEIVRDNGFFGKGDRASLIARVARARLGLGTLPDLIPDIEAQAAPAILPPELPPPTL